jgi:hypothetical protein
LDVFLFELLDFSAAEEGSKAPSANGSCFSSPVKSVGDNDATDVILPGMRPLDCIHDIFVELPKGIEAGVESAVSEDCREEVFSGRMYICMATMGYSYGQKVEISSQWMEIAFIFM